MSANKFTTRCIAVVVLALVFTAVHANVYEFTMSPNEEACFDDYFVNGTTPSMRFEAYKLNKASQTEEITDLSQAGVIDKRKGTAKVTLRVDTPTGIVYSGIKKSEQVRTYKVKETGRIQMCFKNQEKTHVFIIFDLRTGVYSGDLSNIPTGEETDEVMNKLEGVRARLDNSLSLYRQMESYEEQHLKTSNTVLSGVLLISQIMIASIAVVGWGITLLLEKSLKYKKIV